VTDVRNGQEARLDLLAARRDVYPFDPDDCRAYWGLIEMKARQEHSDGCSAVADWYVEACWEHDLHYLTGRRQTLVYDWDSGDYSLVDRDSISRRWADRRFQAVIRGLSRLARWSPLAVWRFWGVRIGGQAGWNRYRATEPYYTRHPDMSPPSDLTGDAA
jgi:hypothetical protein